MMPPKSLINLAPPYPTKLKYLRTQHATSPWLGEGRRGSSLGLWRSLKGEIVAPLSLACLFLDRATKNLCRQRLSGGLIPHLGGEESILADHARVGNQVKLFFLL